MTRVLSRRRAVAVATFNALIDRIVFDCVRPAYKAFTLAFATFTTHVLPYRHPCRFRIDLRWLERVIQYTHGFLQPHAHVLPYVLPRKEAVWVPFAGNLSWKVRWRANPGYVDLQFLGPFDKLHQEPPPRDKKNEPDPIDDCFSDDDDNPKSPLLPMPKRPKVRRMCGFILK